MSRFRKFLHWGPIVALSIIAFLLVCAIVASILWYPPDTWIGCFNLAVFCSWVFLILRNFFKAVLDGPGYVPISWKPEEEEDKQFLKYCKLCKGFKAPRAHHCRKCRRCIMKMDHHCPWINNCVGHKNHKSFTLFLIFVVIGCTHATFLLMMTCFHHLFWEEDFLVIQVYEYDLIQFTPNHLVVFCIATGLSTGVAVAVSFLLYYQVTGHDPLGKHLSGKQAGKLERAHAWNIMLKSILTNQTGVEVWILEKADRERADGSVFIYPYDLGTWNNIKQVLNWSHDYVGDGILWPVKEGCSQYDLTIEQLEQSALKRERMVLHKIVSDYNGSWFPLKYGFRVLYDMPWTDTPRMKVEKNDAVYVTRWRRRWLFGEKVLTKRNAQNSREVPDEPEKGWFPRHCSMEVFDDEDEFLKKLN